jgi:putative Flp pilus-assembly TadE/G-like protein
MLIKPFLRPSVERLRKDETGAVLLWFALSLPVLVLAAAFVINFAKWFEDKRHLQTQVDAAAFAGALDYAVPCDSTADASVAASALKYSGDTFRATSPYNQQVSDVSNVHVVLNQTDYWKTGDSVPGPGSPQYGDLGSACSADFVDVKATHDAPSYFFGSLVPAGVLPNIHAHARVSLVKETTHFGTLPFAVPDLVPRYIYGQFVNEADGSTLSAWSPLTQQFTVGSDGKPVPVTDPTTGADIWNNVAAPVSVTFPAGTAGAGDRIGLRLKIIEGTNKDANCGDPLVTCTEEGTNHGIVFVRGWRAGNALTGAPYAKDVFLADPGGAGGCSLDPYFTNVPCKPGIQATIDFGDRDITDAATKVTAVVDGNSYVLQKPASGNLWQLPAGTMQIGLDNKGNTVPGAHPITLNWTWTQKSGTWRGTTCTSSKPCTGNGSFGTVQSSYVSDDSLTARVLIAQVGDADVVPIITEGANSFQEPLTRNLTITAGVAGLEPASKFSDATVLLRVTGSGSNNQDIDCGKNGDLEALILNGCTTPFQVNPTLTCPDAGTPPDPADCASTQSFTGGKVGQVRKGMDERFSCHPNAWQQDPADPTKIPTIADDDPRLIPLIITTWAAFDTSGTTQVPVVTFAYFYVTGWDNDSADTCAATDMNEPFPTKFGLKSNNGDVWGHFVAHIDSSASGSGGTEGCSLGGLTPCVAVLTQ